MLIFKRIVGQIFVLIIGAACLMFGMWLTEQEEQREKNVTTQEYVNELGEAQR